jgi:uncharacterized protein YdiU (UPF0061 family)
MFDNSYLDLPDVLRVLQTPAPVPTPRLVAWNHDLAKELGLEDFSGDPKHAAQVFSGNLVPVDTQPVALAYAGHQFGHFVPQLGDGRAVLLGEVTDRNGVRFDVQLKGSGRTPFSRGGDGKSVLGPVIREYLVSEAMHRLGVPTTRALAAVTTGETIMRDSLQPGAVLTRVARGHVRVGTFEYLAARGDVDALGRLTDYVIERHFPDAVGAPSPALALFEKVTAAQASLVAHWMSLGFIHGVMNTDNTAISGETIDYGPCAFMDEFRHDKVFSSIDSYGRYAYQHQPLIATWNLSRLASCLLLLDDDRSAFETMLNRFESIYESHYHARMADKLGIDDFGPDDVVLLGQWLAFLEGQELDYSRSFRLLAGRVEDRGAPQFDEFEARWQERVTRSGRTADAISSAMDAVNPWVIPRNHQIERAIVGAASGDFHVFHALRDALSHPFETQPGFEEFAEPPQVEQRITQTFCGT